MATKKNKYPLQPLRKVPTGISGFDQITEGGLPAGRPTLVCGSAGCGKSLFATEFLIRGITQYDEPGVLISFEETADDIKKNVASLGFNIDELAAKKKLKIDHVRIDRNEIEENGEYDLEGLLVRIKYAVQTVKAKRVVLDTIESLFSGLNNEAILRAEIRRLFGWLKENNLTTVITGERGDGQLTRQGLEEYVSDCVILLDHRVIGQISTRRLRIVKYRGSTHGTNEYPFLIDEEGFSVLPITSAGMDYTVSNVRHSTGVPELDEMLGGDGIYQGSTVLLTGSAGTGKSSVAAQLADATCRRGERCLFFSFEESESQILRNMKSIGVHLERHVKSGLLQFHSTRPAMHGLELHLVKMHKLVEQFKPALVIIDPISSLETAGTVSDSASMLMRLTDFLRKKHITAFLVSLTGANKMAESTDEGLSSMVDTWLLLRDVEVGGERNRLIYVLKARGTAHSNQVREFVITSQGVRLVPPYLGTEGVLTGSARLSQEAKETAASQLAREDRERQRLFLEHRRRAVEAQVESLRATFKAEEEEFARTVALNKVRDEQNAALRAAMETRRKAMKSASDSKQPRNG